MDITAFIRELLFGHDCVIIPGFGAFIGNYTSARIDRDTGIFYPPVKRISFNRNLTHNDGLLTGRISEKFRTGYDDAKKRVDEFVWEINRKLERGEKLLFDHIGTFLRNPEGNILFEPDRNTNYHPGSYGLESVQCFPVEGYDVRKQVISRIDRSPVKQASMRKIMWRAAVIIPLLAAIVAVPLKTDLFSTRVELANINPRVTAEFENNRRAVDEASMAEIIITEPAEEISSLQLNEAVPESLPAETLSPPVSEGPYHIITGSFQTEENALTQSEILKTEGYS
ncbi:MAG TPA: hypothetical protein VK861_00250, partial [Bacteroidales bacterium]|nr:hypothetical protein [Bacteroidales bacterium]